MTTNDIFPLHILPVSYFPLRVIINHNIHHHLLLLVITTLITLLVSLNMRTTARC
jgi:hypothetical protein